MSEIVVGRVSAMFELTGHIGVYADVLAEGEIRRGDLVTLMA